MSSGWFACTEPSLCTLLQGKQGVQRTSANLHEPQHHRASKVCRGFSHEFGVVRLYRTFSMNLLEPQQHKASKVWRGLSQEFRVVRLYRTFSSYSIAGETRCAGCLCTSSGWFKHIEPPRTYSNHNFTELARLGSMRFDVLEPPRTSAKAPCTPGFPCTAVAREGSVQSNHPELL